MAGSERNPGHTLWFLAAHAFGVYRDAAKNAKLQQSISIEEVWIKLKRVDDLSWFPRCASPFATRKPGRKLFSAARKPWLSGGPSVWLNSPVKLSVERNHLNLPYSSGIPQVPFLDGQTLVI